MRKLISAGAKRIALGKACEKQFNTCPVCNGHCREANRSDAQAMGIDSFMRGGQIPVIDAVCVECGLTWNVKRYNAARSGWIADKMGIGAWQVVNMARTGFAWVSDSGETMHHALAIDAKDYQECTKDSGKQKCIRMTFNGPAK